MTNFIIISIIYLISVFIVKLAIFFALTKILNRKVKFSRVFKAFLIYEILLFLFVLIYLGFNNFLFIKTSALHILSFIIVSYIIFLISIYFTKLFNWKKGLLVFILMFFIITPLVSTISTRFVLIVIKPDFEETSWDLLFNPPLSLKIINRISESLSGDLIWNYYMSIIIYFNFI